MTDLYIDGTIIDTNGHRNCRHCGDAVPSMPLSMIHLFESGYCSEDCRALAQEALKLQAEQRERRWAK